LHDLKVRADPGNPVYRFNHAVSLHQHEGIGIRIDLTGSVHSLELAASREVRMMELIGKKHHPISKFLVLN
jgi:hypothetical protein